MYNILVVDFSIYKNSITNSFDKEKYIIHISDSAFDAMSKLKAYDFDLVISEVELPGDNAFDLYNYIKKNYPLVPCFHVLNAKWVYPDETSPIGAN